MCNKRLTLIVVLGLAALGLTKSALGQSSSTSAPATKASLKDHQVDAVGHRVGKELLEALAIEYSHRGSGLNVNFSINDTHSGAAGALLDGKDLLVTLSQVSDKTLGSVATRWNAAKPSSQVLCGRSVAIVVHMRNSLDALTQEQIKGVFSGRIKDWKTLGGVDKPIRCYGTDLPDSYARMFSDRILPQQNWGLIYKKKDGPAVLEALSTDPAGIAFVNAIDVAGKADSVKIIGIGSADKAVFLNTQTIKDGSYPLAETLMLYVSPSAGAIAREFSKYVFSGDCDAVFLRHGYMPSLRAVRADVLETFNRLYGESIRKAKATSDPEDDLSLAKTMIDSAKTTQTLDPDLMQMMCLAACDLCKGAVASESLMTDVTKFMAEKFPDRKLEHCQKLASYYDSIYDKTPEKGEKLLDALINTIELAVQMREHSEAANSCNRALAVAQEIKSPKLDYINKRSAPIFAREEILKEIGQLQDKLREDPKDAQAKARIAMILLMERDLPAEAAKYLDTFSDPTMRTNIPLAVAKVESLSKDAALKMAEWYLDLYEKAGSGGKEMMLRRSKLYYGRFMDLHKEKDNLATRAELGYKKVKAAMDDLCPECPVESFVIEVHKDGDWIDLLSRIDVKRDSMIGQWAKEGKVLTLNSCGQSVLQLPAVCEGNLEMQITFKARNRDADVGLLFAMAGHRVFWGTNMAGKDERVTGFAMYAGRSAESQEKSVLGPAAVFTPNKEHTLYLRSTVKGEKAEVIVRLDDKPFYQYNGPAKDPADVSYWAKTGPNMPGLFSYGGDLTFTRIGIKAAKLDVSPSAVAANGEKPVQPTTPAPAPPKPAPKDTPTPPRPKPR